MEVRAGELIDRRVADFPALVPAGSLVVCNDTSVIRARLLGHKARTGGKAELLLVARMGDERASPCEEERWWAIGKGLLIGQKLVLTGGKLLAEVLGKSETEGLYDVRLVSSGGPVASLIEEHGRVPIPPYIRRADDDTDRERYQTVYARRPGAIAAPTAGLHLTWAMLDELRRRSVRIGFVTLHVGLGTFAKVAVDDLDRHAMHAEWMEVTPELVSEVELARERDVPVIAVGTTVVRALESARDRERVGHVVPMAGETRLLIQPGYAFGVVDALLTNFHLPRSTLLALVAAFAGRERVLSAYAEAVRRGYRFYSYGDAMWIPSRAPANAEEAP